MIKSIYKRFYTLFSFLNEKSKQKQAPFLIEKKGVISKAGKQSYHNGNFTAKGNGELKIGSYCAFGVGITIILSNHNYDFPSIQYTFYRNNFNQLPYKSTKQKTIIGNDVWIGDNVIILPNITIGTGAILAANAIVTRDVKPYAIMGGNPARLIKYRFSENVINEMLASEWWNWDEDKIKENREFFFRNYNNYEK